MRNAHSHEAYMRQLAETRRTERAQETERLRALHDRGMGVRDIAARLGKSRGVVWNALAQLGLKPNPEEG